jgi:hypothetical protein
VKRREKKKEGKINRNLILLNVLGSEAFLPQAYKTSKDKHTK